MKLTKQKLEKLETSVAALVETHGQKLLSVWQSKLDFTLKDIRDPVTKFDVATENALRAELSELLPEAGFIVEEGTNTAQSEYTWIIDPIDQTKNFVGHIPIFYTQVALMHGSDPVIAVIYNPVSQQLFSARAKGGVTLNGVPLSLTPKATLAECIVDIDLGGQEDITKKIAMCEAIARQAFRIRMTGGAYATYLVTGGIDAFVVLNKKTKIVDQAPRMLIARELGLRFDYVPIQEEWHGYVAGSRPVCEALLNAIRQAG